MTRVAHSNARPPRWALLRASWIWGGILGGALVVRYLLDTLVPPADYFLRATVSSYAIIAACLLAGFTTAWRGRSMRAGIVTSSSAAIIGALISIVGAGVMLAIGHDAATLDAWRRSGGLGEALIGVPLEVVAIGMTVGFAGAFFGMGMAVVSRSR